MKSNVGKVNIFELCVSHLRQEGEKGKIAVPLLSHYLLHFLQQKLNINDHHQKGHGGTTVQKKMPKIVTKLIELFTSRKIDHAKLVFRCSPFNLCCLSSRLLPKLAPLLIFYLQICKV